MGHCLGKGGAGVAGDEDSAVDDGSIAFDMIDDADAFDVGGVVMDFGFGADAVDWGTVGNEAEGVKFVVDGRDVIICDFFGF